MNLSWILSTKPFVNEYKSNPLPFTKPDDNEYYTYSNDCRDMDKAGNMIAFEPMINPFYQNDMMVYTRVFLDEINDKQKKQKQN